MRPVPGWDTASNRKPRVGKREGAGGPSLPTFHDAPTAITLCKV